METIRKAWAAIGPVAKAVVAGVAAGFTYLVAQGTIDPSLNPVAVVSDTLANFGAYSLNEWLLFVGAIGATYGFTWYVPNR